MLKRNRDFLIKKTAATTLSVIGMLSMMPSALCAPEEANDIPPQNNVRGHIDPFNIMVVGKYLNSVYDLFNLQMSNKKCEDLLERYHFNPVAITSREQLALYPNIETCHIGKFRGDFISTFPNDKIKTLVYLPGSFNASQFKEVLSENGVYTDKWKRTFELNGENPEDGCSVTFTKDSKTFVFMFSLYPNGELAGSYFNGQISSGVKCYNDLLEKCGVEDVAKVTLKEKLVIPPNVTNIRCLAFAGCTNLKEVIIPNSVKNIAKSAFSDCRDLREVTIPDSVTSIGEKAFCNCENLREINIPNSVTSIGDSAFSNCRDLREITIPNSVKSIGNNAFSDCKNLREITIPDSITSIGEATFANCTNLKKVTIPNSVTSIGNSAFGYCEDLEEINIPDSVTSIEENAFVVCKSLREITIPNSVASIGNSAFANCENLTKISIPNSVKEVKGGAFDGCLGLNHIEYNGKVYTDKCEFMKDFKASNDEFRKTYETIKKVEDPKEKSQYCVIC